MNEERKYYWLAIVSVEGKTGSAVVSLLGPQTCQEAESSSYIPGIYQLIGFATMEECVAANKTLLTAPADELKALYQSWMPRIESREMGFSCGSLRPSVTDGSHKHGKDRQQRGQR